MVNEQEMNKILKSIKKKDCFMFMYNRGWLISDKSAEELEYSFYFQIYMSGEYSFREIYYPKALERLNEKYLEKADKESLEIYGDSKIYDSCRCLNCINCYESFKGSFLELDDIPYTKRLENVSNEYNNGYQDGYRKAIEEYIAQQQHQTL